MASKNKRDNPLLVKIKVKLKPGWHRQSHVFHQNHFKLEWFSVNFVDSRSLECMKHVTCLIYCTTVTLSPIRERRVFLIESPSIRYFEVNQVMFLLAADRVPLKALHRMKVFQFSRKFDFITWFDEWKSINNPVNRLKSWRFLFYSTRPACAQFSFSLSPKLHFPYKTVA